ncbi:Acyl-CoA synthetase (AMP-forming)/AMP-acid ligase II [Trujillonella endophytica]|uniref:Acyl-CoA synthetase (AMP-forming)/AMP-acid ligase II n=2 Tax=Trujillonella endophytica TaxID=673521 RepID=A0A1H8Q578_9ACTN|nr:Acyl-CoA synthetase (AMP-forming)/AMP-acid ligase II [Trujillella endophytica]
MAVLAEDAQYTYQELQAAVEQAAAGLSALGVRPRDRVGLCLGNEPAWIVAFFALARLRAAAVLLSTAWREHEMAHALALTGPVAVIADAASAAVVDAVGRPGLAVVVGPEPREGWTPFGALRGDAGTLPETGDPAELELALPFSSGTTGLPKAVRHTHRSLCAATTQWRESLGVTATDRLQGITPLSHILGIVNVGATFEGTATIRLFRRFDTASMVESFAADRITIGLTVAPIAAALAAMPDLERFDLRSLRYLNWSATPVNAEIARRVTERTGVGWRPAYGTTEVPILAMNPAEGARLDSVGLAPRGVQLEAIDPGTLEFLPRGRTGELVARSTAAMLGYLPEDAPDPFLDGGWYRTGDLGHVEPEGWIVVSGRLKELIKVSGYQVSPVEIENLLATSPLVADCAVFGAPDDRRGEAPCAAVVPAAGWTPDAQELLDWLSPRLAPYKRLRDVFFVEAIPRTPSGKIQRRHLTPLTGA